MPVSMPPGFKLGVVEPKDAVRAFQARKLLQPTFSWQDMWNEEHAHAFTVAKLFSADLLQAVYDQLGDAIANGTSFEDFSKSLIPKLEAGGYWGKDIEVTDPATGEVGTTTFDPSRLNLIYDVNLRQSQAAGRWARIERGRAVNPYVIYRTMRDERVRASHRPWDGVVLPIDDPFWDTHYPPCGFRCRCTAYAINQTGIDRLRAAGQPIKTEAPPDRMVEFTNRRTGEVTELPKGVDPGFGYNPGKALLATRAEVAVAKVAPLAPAIGADLGASIAPAVTPSLNAEFAKWVDQVLAEKLPRGDFKQLGAVGPVVVADLARFGVKLDSAAIAIRDRDLLHMTRDVKVDPLPLDFLRSLPEKIANPDAVLLDKSALDDAPSLVYVYDVQDGDTRAKLVLILNYGVKARDAQGKRQTISLNVIRTGRLMMLQALDDPVTYELLDGAL